MVLIDTSAWLFALRTDFNPAVRARIDAILYESDVAINGMICLELLGGMRTEEEYTRLRDRLASLHHIDATRELWDAACHMAFTLKRRGVTVPYTDIFIAASALMHDALLVHADRHFDLIAWHAGVKVESLVSIIGQ